MILETSFQPRIYNIAERRNYTPNFASSDYETNFVDKGTPLVIDNGSYQCRVGWATDISPRLQFDNLVSKYKDRKLNQSILLVGNDVYTDATAKTNAKSAFDGNVVYNFETMESVLDYIFIKLGINTDKVNHPILMTEPVCNPSHSRKLMSELLFECYRVPSVCYGIDALFSFHFNGLSFDEGGIVISSGHTTTHVIPVLGRGVLGQTKRISYGGLTSTDYMLKLMQLKYPTFPTKMTVNQAQHLVHNHTYVAEDYFSELKEYTDPKKFAEKDRIIQFPYVPPANEKSEEELARAEERRQEQARRLKEQAAKLRHQKLKDLESTLEFYMEIKTSKSSMKKAEFIAKLKENRISDEAELDEIIQKTEKSVQRARNKLLGIEEVEIKEEPTFPLVDIPDDQLNEAERKEKKKQIASKSLHETRQRQREAKELARRQQEEEKRMEEQRRQTDFEGWLNELKHNYQNQLDKVKSLKRKKEQLSDRRSHASQLRMKSIANLASDTPQQKRRRRGQDEDTFGMDDNDWSIYKEISREEDAWEEEEEHTLLREYETKLLQYDPTFLPEHTFDAKNSVKNSLIFMFTRGVTPPFDPENFAQMHQLHVNVERIRVPEALFQPSILGLDQAGIVETIGEIISRFEDVDAKKKMIQSIFVTGGHTQTPGLLKRLEISLGSILPAGSPLQIIHAKDPVLDAWHGAALWARSSEFQNYYVTVEEYNECGGEYIKEHRFGNVYYKT
ncbi:actin-like ATPase domain-containing protein [Gigaspora margarita]|uniref:Actin-like ATPase domain-containing protein n=1 Tax=Gigaspora margarita TaxID=4874 RepID=A0A8H4EHE2_GIGMA|nr:actin-like ATPase domain-containing protein [Gigaspora margarita]